MKVQFYTLGCKVNQYESEAMGELFEKRGYTVVGEDEPADIVIINSCTVTAESNRKTRQTVRKARRKNSQAVIVLTGCMAQAFPDEAAKIVEADIVVGNKNEDKIPDLCERFIAERKAMHIFEEHETGEKITDFTVTGFSEHTRSYIKIEDGCNRFCSYCIIPYARGRVRSKSVGAIAAEAEGLSRSGYKEIVLVGINLSAYGQDTGAGLCDAVLAAAAPEGIERVRLGSLECDQISDDALLKLSECKEFCPQFHLSLQSGCDRTLREMNRKYDTAFYRDLVERIRRIFPDASITTDIMVGFPGESDEDFKESCDFVRETGFARSHVFIYSEREGTPAARRHDAVDKSVRAERAHIMGDICRQCERDFLKAQCGKTEKVLFETESDGYWEGYTGNYTRIKVKSAGDLEGKILPVVLTAANEDYCIGELRGESENQ
ncbi:MAG: tRNA (N(6)-L-threonylcarbamoyladenosine(37)-C(2))-methylthiotransferase MtaB [Acutalibacteraceae bacterium]